MNGDPRSHGLWEKTAPEAPPAPKLSGDVDCDVADRRRWIHWPFRGAACGARAARRSLVLDGAEIGFGGSGRNVGLVNAGMWTMPDELPKTLGDTYGQRLLALLGDAPRACSSLSTGTRSPAKSSAVGTLHCAVDRRGLRRTRGA